MLKIRSIILLICFLLLLIKCVYALSIPWYCPSLHKGNGTFNFTDLHLGNIDYKKIWKCYNQTYKSVLIRFYYSDAIPTNILKHLSTESLDLSDNKFKNLTFQIKYEEREKKLYNTTVSNLLLRNNQLEFIEHGALESIQKTLVGLDLSKNNIKNLSSFKSLENLKTLNLSYNKIETITFSDVPISIETIYLQENNIKHISYSEFEKYIHLSAIDLSHQNISNIVIENFTFYTVKEVKIVYNSNSISFKEDHPFGNSSSKSPIKKAKFELTNVTFNKINPCILTQLAVSASIIHLNNTKDFECNCKLINYFKQHANMNINCVNRTNETCGEGFKIDICSLKQSQSRLCFNLFEYKGCMIIIYIFISLCGILLIALVTILIFVCKKRKLIFRKKHKDDFLGQIENSGNYDDYHGGLDDCVPADGNYVQHPGDDKASIKESNDDLYTKITENPLRADPASDKVETNNIESTWVTESTVEKQNETVKYDLNNFNQENST